MSTPFLPLLFLQGLVFAYWAYLMFSTLFRLRRRGEEKTGHTFSGPGTTLGEMRNFLTNPQDHSARNRLGLITLLMFGLIATSAYVNSYS